MLNVLSQNISVNTIFLKDSSTSFVVTLRPRTLSSSMLGTAFLLGGGYVQASASGGRNIAMDKINIPEYYAIVVVTLGMAKIASQMIGAAAILGGSSVSIHAKNGALYTRPFQAYNVIN